MIPIAGFGQGAGESNCSSAMSMPKACADYARAEAEFSNKQAYLSVRPISRKVILTSPLPLRPFSDIAKQRGFRAPQAIATNEGRLCNPTQSKPATRDQKTIPGEEGPDPLLTPAYFQLN
jgi:hypothetical protein